MEGPANAGLSRAPSVADFLLDSDVVIEEVFSLAGPRLFPLEARAGVREVKKLGVIVDPPGGAPQIRGLLWLFRGFTLPSYDFAARGVPLLIGADPVVELGQEASWLAESEAALMALVEVMNEWRQKSGPPPDLPDLFLDQIASLYVRENPFFPEDESALTLRPRSVMTQSRLFQELLSLFVGQEDGGVRHSRLFGSG
jgi:hypothetical protein